MNMTILIVNKWSSHCLSCGRNYIHDGKDCEGCGLAFVAHVKTYTTYRRDADGRFTDAEQLEPFHGIPQIPTSAVPAAMLFGG